MSTANYSIRPRFAMNGMHMHMHQNNYFIAPVIITCLVDTDTGTTSEESIDKSDANGFRVRKVFSDHSLTSAQLAREVVENRFAYLYVICNEFVESTTGTGAKNCDITVSYGDGNKTRVLIRHEGREGEDIVTGKILLVVRMSENGKASLLRPDDLLLGHLQSCSSHPAEIHVSPSLSIYDPSAFSSDIEEVEENVLIIVMDEENEIKSVEMSPSKETIEEYSKSNNNTSRKNTLPIDEAAMSCDFDYGNHDSEGLDDELEEEDADSSGSNIPEKLNVTTDSNEEEESDTTTRHSSPSNPIGTDKPSNSVNASSDDEEAPTKLDAPSKAKGKDPAVEKNGESENHSVAENDNSKGGTKRISETSNEMVGKKSKLKKPRKDPNAPRRPMTTYMLFCKDNRAKIKSENPDVSFIEMGKILGEAYRNLSTEEKESYEKQFAVLKAQYDKKKAQYDKEKSNSNSEGADGNGAQDEEEDAELSRSRIPDNPQASKDSNEEEKSDAKSAPSSPIGTDKSSSRSANGPADDEEVSRPLDAPNKSKGKDSDGVPSSPPRRKALMRSAKNVKPPAAEQNNSIKSKENERKNGDSYSLVENDGSKTSEKRTSETPNEMVEKKSKSKKPRKDPNAPRRPMTTYMLFCKDNRAKIKSENPNVKFTEIGKILGEAYRNLSIEEKENYEKQSTKLKAQYDKEKAQYEKEKSNEAVDGNEEPEVSNSVDSTTANVDVSVQDQVEVPGKPGTLNEETSSSTKLPKGSDGNTKKSKKRGKSDDSETEEIETSKKKKTKKKIGTNEPVKPKRPLSTYMLFCKQHRAEATKKYPHLTVPQLGQKLAEMYHEAPKKELDKIKETAEKLKLKYIETLSEFIEKTRSAAANDTDSASEFEIQEIEKPSMKKKKKYSYCPKKTRSSYLYFCSARRKTLAKECPDMKVPELGKRLSSEWKKLSLKERKKFTDLAVADKKRYEKEMEEYNGSRKVVNS